MLIVQFIILDINQVFLILAYNYIGKNQKMHKFDDLEIVTEQEGQGFYVAQFKTKQLAIFTYYIQSNKQAVIIDPIFNTKGYHQFIAKRNSHLKYVLLTHYHADFISGHLEFNGLPIVMGPSAIRAESTFKIQEHDDGSSIKFGSVALKIIHTPGHTMQSACFLLKDKNRRDVALFSGDTIFLGQVGRPDLAIKSNLTAKDLAGMLYDSIQKLKSLSGDIRLYPGHGSGSSCGKSIGAGNYCTMEAQFKNNYGFTVKNRQQFIKEASQNLPKPPAYFFHDAKLNQIGFESYNSYLGKSHVHLKLEQFSKYSHIVKVVDTRAHPTKGILKGSYWLPESGPIVNWISYVVHPDEQFILIVDHNKEIDIMDRLFRIGYFKIKGYNAFDIYNLKGQFVIPKLFKCNEVQALGDVYHLDVRNIGEHKQIGGIEGFHHIALPELESRIGELKDAKNILVNCLSGFRSKIAFSILAKHNIQSSILADNFKDLVNHGCKLVPFKN